VGKILSVVPCTPVATHSLGGATFKAVITKLLQSLADMCVVAAWTAGYLLLVGGPDDVIDHEFAGCCV